MTSEPLRIAVLAHSTNPRGGVVHALALGDALANLGCEAVVHAPDADGRGFFRQPTCKTALVATSAIATGDADAPESSDADIRPSSASRRSAIQRRERAAENATLAMVEARIADYVRHFQTPENRRFDVFHAQDGISGNALATLKERGLIAGFARTVHHIDDFADPRLAALQWRSIARADAHFVVSRPWRARLKTEFDLDATIVGNGVDLERFSRQPGPEDIILRARLGLQGGPVFLAIGGVEERKNTVRLLQAFVQVHAMRPTAQLVIAGGRSLLDHGAYQARFTEALDASGLPAHAVLRLGPVADPDMPALFRNADALVFPSVKEGFGLVVLEALASGLPVVTSSIPPFTDYLGEADVLWCTPDTTGSIADAMMLALLPALRRSLATRGPTIAARHDWHDTARAHLPLYERLGSPIHA